ncbi:MAG: choice-of-anchor J domain-containing protein, partial [Bacteroidetes bacterium]|nr:choice-of-anchor J domain-containing protein [Bacteroidota bacterium]
PVASPNFNCPTGVNSCSNDTPDLPDQVENYMDYTNDACANMFTNGQKLRMQAALDTIRTIVWSDSNLIATGCDSGYVSPACTVIADLVTLTPDICVGNSIYFMDKSLNNAISWQWTFPGGTPDSSTLQNPSVTYDSVGTYAVTMIAGDSSAFDTIILPGYISVTNPGIGDTLPFSEDFESGIFPPPGITINNPDAGITWELDSLASTSGKYSIRINNLINTNYGSTDEIILPFFNLAPTRYPFLEFNWAYARSDPNFSDELIVLLSVDCGNTFNQIFYGSGTSLATGPTQTTPFIPDSSQWRSASISLKNYDTLTYVLIKLVNVTDGGNNLYIDDISVSGSPLVLIPDTNFRNYLRISYPSYMDLSGDSLITKAATSLKTTLSCSNRNIRDLTGIEYFINIPGLFCQNNKLNSLPDLSGNTALKFLRCSNNQLTSVPNLSANNFLVTFYVENNKLDFSDAGMLRIADNVASSLIVYEPQNPFGMADTVIFSAGDTLVFSIASQDSAISYGWFFNGDTIPGATDTILIIPDITTADVGVYTCKSYGTALLSPPMSFGPGISEFVSEPFIVIDTSATSVSDIFADHAILKVFPNPFSDKITLEYTLDRSSNIQITIYDNLGRVVKSFREQNKEPGTYRIYFQPGNTYSSSSLFLVRMVAGKKDVLKGKSVIFIE